MKCDTCRVSQTYYTEVGVRYFKTMHSDHNVVEGDALHFNETPEVLRPRTVQRTTAHLPTESEKVADPFKIASNETVVAGKSSHAIESSTNLQPMGEQVKPSPKVPLIAEPKQERSHRSEVSIEKTTVKNEEVKPSLLLGKFSFVKEGERYRKEALRISNVLKTFRWNVQPPYVIGALFDDNLSIQSSTGVVSREVIMGVEQLGYYFVAVESPKGVMTAWFKNEGVQ